MNISSHLLSSHLLPWRVRTRIERWLETVGYDDYPALYRWLLLGHAAEVVRPVTRGPQHHFFGYYDKTPWNKSGRWMLAHEVGFNDRPPRPQDVAGIGIVEADGSSTFTRLSSSRTWNWQQGTMLQWDPLEPEQQFVFNDLRDGRFVSVVHHVDMGELTVLDRPVCALQPDGRAAFSIDFARLATLRPGYGYGEPSDEKALDPLPADEGIWLVDRGSGSSTLVVPLSDLAAREPRRSMEGACHYVNHVQPSRTGRRVAFFHIWHRPGEPREVRLYTCRPDGSELTCLLDTGFISHYDWRDDDAIVVWANQADGPPRFLWLTHAAVDRPTRSAPVFGASSLHEDGHCSFSPDARWVLNDTYPDAHDKRTLMLVRASDGHRYDVARLRSPKSSWWGEMRCDLHPRWSRDGTRVCIDSVHDGSRQMYVVDVSRWVQ